MCGVSLGILCFLLLNKMPFEILNLYAKTLHTRRSSNALAACFYIVCGRIREKEDGRRVAKVDVYDSARHFSC